jgi:FG-GAP-like repeat
LVYLGLGNGRFASPNVLPIIAESDGFVTGDFNGDSKLDILVRSDVYSARANGVYPLVLYTGDGTGGFLEEAINIPGIDANSNFTGGLQTLAVDVNKDGRTEVVFNLPDRLAIVKYTNECSWTNSEIYLTDFEKSRQQMISGDINGDGSTDIITMGSQEINVMLGQASGRFQVKKFNPFDDDLRFNGSSKLQIIDVNNDRKLDLVISGTDSTGKQSLKVYTLNAAGDLVQQGNATKLPTVTGRTSTFQTLADINGDGTPELLMNVSGGQIGVVKNKTVASQTVTLTRSYTYDSRFNQLTSETDELGRKTLYDLDANTGKVLKTTHVIGQLDTSSGETNDVVTSYTYTLI